MRQPRCSNILPTTLNVYNFARTITHLKLKKTIVYVMYFQWQKKTLKHKNVLNLSTQHLLQPINSPGKHSNSQSLYKRYL